MRRHFASGPKETYYGKGDVCVYRLQRRKETEAESSIHEGQVFAANIQVLVYGQAFWPTYTQGDNTAVVATDSMKNFIQREALQYAGHSLAGLLYFLGQRFLETYPQMEGVQLSATELPFEALAPGQEAFTPASKEYAVAQIELQRHADGLVLRELRAGLCGLKLLRLGGSSFTGFVRDAYTTLPEMEDRPLYIFLDLEWRYHEPDHLFIDNAHHLTQQVCELIHEVFQGLESRSIQQLIYTMGSRVLEHFPQIAEVSLEAQNRLWDQVAESPTGVGIYTNPRPPYGILGLTLRR
jgi:urate oxidase